jgi:protein-tyrosine phosphatase
VDWITDHIAIGNFLDAQSLPDGIDAVLCLREGCCETRSDVNARSVPLRDGPGNHSRDLADALQFLDETARAGERVLVHCHAGRSRSVIVVARWLMRSRGLTPTAALEYIAQRREVYLSPGITDLLSAPLP